VSLGKISWEDIRSAWCGVSVWVPGLVPIVGKSGVTRSSARYPCGKNERQVCTRMTLVFQFFGRLFVMFPRLNCAPMIQAALRVCMIEPNGRCAVKPSQVDIARFAKSTRSRHATSWAFLTEGRPLHQLKKTSRQNKGPASHSCENRLLALQHGRSVQAQ